MSILDSGRAPAAKFPTLKTRVGGPITEAPRETQQIDFKSGDPLTWNDGSPRMQWAITVQTDRCDNKDDDGRRRIFAKGRLLNEIRSAVRKAGARDLEVGGVLTVTYVADGEPADPELKPPKIYAATYTPPDDSADDDEPIGIAELVGTAELGDIDDTDDVPF